MTANPSPAAESGVLRLHPDNPHYFLWRGKPTVLITSAEHYGAVLNLDFDHIKYLDTLARHGFNLTRTFTGAAYLEPEGIFAIAGNTLAPKAGRYLAPWARSGEPGAWDGGNKWDLTRWNEAYFTRFVDFAEQAARRGIVVEVNLFCPFYVDKDIKKSRMWPLSPFHPTNNVNSLGSIPSENVYTLDRHGGLLEAQERFVRRLVATLRDFDNIYYEICNEPYFAGVTLEWQHHIADLIQDAQKGHTAQKLISQNIANKSAKIVQPHPAVSIFNFHYAYPPAAVAENFSLNKVIGENETGFRGTADEVYRNEAWDFMLAGGGLFNNLDFSFAAGREDGSFAYPAAQPGGGGQSFHRQLAVLARFMNGIDFVKMKPANGLVTGLREGVSIRLLADQGRHYAAYLHHSAPPAWKNKSRLNAGAWRDEFRLRAPKGTYVVEWIDPATGMTQGNATRAHDGGSLRVETPSYARDIAVRIDAK